VDAGSGRVERVHLTDVDLGESKLRGVEFVDVIAERVDAANGDWGGAQVRRTLFQGASIKATVFSRCKLVEADFSKADMSLVDLRGSELRLAGSVLGLRGAIIDPLQLMELSGTLAQELGITVEDV
jgi:uncharacterized protein YjbI with pentapeptide repeats